MARQNKNYYVEQGLCISCWKRETSEGLKTCDACREGQKKRNKKHYEKNKELGLCTACGKERAAFGNRCLNCRIIQNKYDKKRYQDVKSQRENREKLGICVSCGKRPATGKSKYCLNCQETKRRYEIRHCVDRRMRLKK